MKKTRLGLCLALFLGLSLCACTAVTPGTPTAMPETATPIPPVATPTALPETATPVPPTPTPVPTAAPTSSSLGPYGGALLKPLASDDAQGHLERGLAAFEDDRAGLAAAHFTRAIELEPDLTDAYLYRGIALAVMDEYDRPSDFERVIEDRPDDAEASLLPALYGYADLRGIESERCTIVAKALELDPALAEAKVLQGVCVCSDAEGGSDRARRAFDLFLEARAADPAGVDALYAVAALGCFSDLYQQEQAQQIEPILPSLDKDIASNPDLPGGYFARAQAILWLREYTIEETVDAWIDMFQFLKRGGCPIVSQKTYGFDRSDALAASAEYYHWWVCLMADRVFDSIWDDQIDLSGVDALMAKDAQFKAKFEELQRVVQEYSTQVVFPPELREVKSVSLLPDRDTVATRSEYGDGILFWSLDGTPLGAADLGESVRSVVFSRDGRRMATTDDEAHLRLWDLVEVANTPGAAPLHEIELSDDASRLAFSADGSQLAVVVGLYGGPSQVWSTETGELLCTVPLTDSTESLAIAPESHRMAWAFGEQAAILDTETGKELFRLGEPCTDDYGSCSTHTIAVSPDERLVATAGRMNPNIRAWDLASGELASALGGPCSGGGSMVFSPDSRLLATGDSNGVVCLWDVSSGKLLLLMGHRSAYDTFGSDFEVRAVAFSADGRRIVTGGADGTARVWDTATGAELAIIYAVMPESSEE